MQDSTRLPAPESSGGRKRHTSIIASDQAPIVEFNKFRSMVWSYRKRLIDSGWFAAERGPNAMVLIALSRYVNKKRLLRQRELIVWPKRRTLIKCTGYERATVDKALRELLEHGRMFVVAPGGGRSSTVYKLAWPPRGSEWDKSTPFYSRSDRSTGIEGSAHPNRTLRSIPARDIKEEHALVKDGGSCTTGKAAAAAAMLTPDQEAGVAFLAGVGFGVRKARELISQSDLSGIPPDRWPRLWAEVKSRRRVDNPRGLLLRMARDGDDPPPKWKSDQSLFADPATQAKANEEATAKVQHQAAVRRMIECPDDRLEACLAWLSESDPRHYPPGKITIDKLRDPGSAYVARAQIFLRLNGGCA